MKLLVYVPLLTPRIRYVFNFIFNDILKTQVGFSSNLAEFKSSALPKITYSDHPVENELFFKNTDLLLSHTIAKPSFKTTSFGDMIVPFAVDNSSLPFDVFAASFYFVSRYEEYLPFKPDEDGCYPPEISLQFRLKMLEFPVIDGWALMLKNMLLKQYPTLYFGKTGFAYTPLVCLYKSTGIGPFNLLRQTLSFFSRFASSARDNTLLTKKINGLQLFLKDNHEKYNISPVYFLKPSPEIDQDCTRQIALPNSYLQLLKYNKLKDYRMGYPETIGFRAGTCTPFFWYDLQLEKTTSLLVHPIAINDLILQRNRTFNMEEILNKWGTLIRNVKLLKGHLYIIWHKETLPEYGKGKVGRRLYTELLTKFLSLPDDSRPE